MTRIQRVTALLFVFMVVATVQATFANPLRLTQPTTLRIATISGYDFSMPAGRNVNDIVTPSFVAGLGQPVEWVPIGSGDLHEQLPIIGPTVDGIVITLRQSDEEGSYLFWPGDPRSRASAELLKSLSLQGKRVVILADGINTGSSRGTGVIAQAFGLRISEELRGKVYQTMTWKNAQTSGDVWNPVEFARPLAGSWTEIGRIDASRTSAIFSPRSRIAGPVYFGTTCDHFNEENPETAEDAGINAYELGRLLR
ncbi:hypothetical protein JNK13_02735 [bacterium]|nr:hypothetical protein [bacterium]